MATIHLIRFPNKKEHKRGLMAVLDVAGHECLGLPDYQLAVTDEHHRALELARVRFTVLSQPTGNGPQVACVQSESHQGTLTK